MSWARPRAKRTRPRPRHLMRTRRERATDMLVWLVCRLAGHVPQEQFSGTRICGRCRTPLAR